MAKMLTVDTELSLPEIFKRLDSSSQNVSFFHGLAKEWQSLLAFNPIAICSVSDVANIDQLQTFFDDHTDHLVCGHVSYDLGRELQGVPSQHLQSNTPLLTFYAYDKYLWQKEEQVLCSDVDTSWQNEIQKLITSAALENTFENLHLEQSITKDWYRSGFEKIQKYIREGDIYQINYTFPLSAKTRASSREIFSHYHEQKPVSYAAYIESDNADIISLSPESFYHEKDGLITTCPIKGTRPRGAQPDEDLALREQLMASKKEQAELFMIVDLLRNDLGKVCEIGSVEVTRSKEVTALPNVWHTYSEVQGKRKSSISSVEAMLSMLPGGSITGCPKIRAMEVIDELEVKNRGVYTGSLGYRLPDGEMAFNIAIRTLVKKKDKVSLGVGGGITIKSDCDDEHQEALAKSHFFTQT